MKTKTLDSSSNPSKPYKLIDGRYRCEYCYQLGMNKYCQSEKAFELHLQMRHSKSLRKSHDLEISTPSDLPQNNKGETLKKVKPKFRKSKSKNIKLVTCQYCGDRMPKNELWQHQKKQHGEGLPLRVYRGGSPGLSRRK